MIHCIHQHGYTEREEFEKNKAALIDARTEQKASEALSNYVAELRRRLGDKLKVDPRFSGLRRSPTGGSETASP